MNTATAFINPSLSEEDEDDDDRGFLAAMPNRCFINFNKDKDEDGDEKRLMCRKRWERACIPWYCRLLALGKKLLFDWKKILDFAGVFSKSRLRSH